MSDSSSPSLPPRPSLEYLRRLAKDRLAELRRADGSARLATAQLAVARDHGFSSWRALRAHLDRERPAGVEPPREAVWPDPRVQELFGAIARRDVATLERLLISEPALANARDAESATALSVAAEVNDPGLVTLLLARGADPERVYAHSAHTHLEIAKLLVDAGADPAMPTAEGKTPLDLALESPGRAGCVAVAAWLGNLNSHTKGMQR